MKTPIFDGTEKKMKEVRVYTKMDFEREKTISEKSNEPIEVVFVESDDGECRIECSHYNTKAWDYIYNLAKDCKMPYAISQWQSAEIYDTTDIEFIKINDMLKVMEEQESRLLKNEIPQENAGNYYIGYCASINNLRSWLLYCATKYKMDK